MELEKLSKAYKGGYPLVITIPAYGFWSAQEFTYLSGVFLTPSDERTLKLVASFELPVLQEINLLK